MSEESARRHEALVQAGLVLASELSLPAVLQKIVEAACVVADARYGALGVLGSDGLIERFVTHGVTEEERRAIGRLPVGKGILGVLINEARPLRLRRIQDDPRSVGFPANHPRMTSFLGVPVEIHGTVYGNLYLTEKRGEAEFSEDDERAVITLAAQAGVAIENARLYEEATSRQRRLEAVHEVAQAVLSGAAIDDLLRLVAERARGLSGADLSTVAVPEAEGDTFTIRVAEGAHAGELRGVRFPSPGSISGDVVRTGEPTLIPDVSADPRVDQPLVRMGDVGSVLFVPLAVADRSFGTLTVGNLRDGGSLDEQDLSVTLLLAAQAAVALDYDRIREELRRLAVLKDRERIAKELHDGVVQALFAVGMGLQAAEMVADDPATVRERITGAVEEIDRVIRDLRNYIFGLRPGLLADRQLGRALEELVHSIAQPAGVASEVDIEDEAVSLLAGRAADLVQVAREATSNAVRHSGSDLIVLSLRRAGNTAILEVADQGKGFDPERPGRAGQGLGNLRARAEALGGALEVDSSPGRGTRVRITVPL